MTFKYIKPLKTLSVPLVIMAALSGCTNIVPDYLETVKSEDRQMCRSRSRMETTLRGTATMQMTDSFDLYIHCVNSLQEAARSTAANDRSVPLPWRDLNAKVQLSKPGNFDLAPVFKAP